MQAEAQKQAQELQEKAKLAEEQRIKAQEDLQRLKEEALKQRQLMKKDQAQQVDQAEFDVNMEKSVQAELIDLNEKSEKLVGEMDEIYADEKLGNQALEEEEILREQAENKNGNEVLQVQYYSINDGREKEASDKMNYWQRQDSVASSDKDRTEEEMRYQKLNKLHNQNLSPNSSADQDFYWS